MSGVAQLRAYQQGGPVRDKLKQLWEGIRSKADDPSLGYIGASMLPGIGEATDLVEIGAGLQDRSLGRVGLGLAGLMLPFVGAAGLKKIGKQVAKPKRRAKGQMTSRQKQKMREAVAEEAGGDVKDVNKNIEVIKARLRETPETRQKRIAQEMIDRVRPVPVGSTLPKSHSEYLLYRMPFASREMSAATRLAPRPGDLSPAQIKDISKLPRAERMKALGYDLDVYHGTDYDIQGSHLKVIPEVQANWGRGNLGRGIYTHEDPKVADYFTSDPIRNWMWEAERLKRLYQDAPHELPEGLETLEDIFDIGKAYSRGAPFRWSQASGSQVLPLKARTSRLLTVGSRATPKDIYKDIDVLRSQRDLLKTGRSGTASILSDEEILRRAMPTPSHEMVEHLGRRGGGWGRAGMEGGAAEVGGLAELAQKAGYEGLRVHPHAGGFAWQDYDLPHEILTFEPGAGLRGRFAKFDPRKLHHKDLLAGIGGLASARYMSNAMREDQS